MDTFGTVTSAQAKGSRDLQEDRVVVLSDIKCVLIAVMDGHEGVLAAEVCAKNIPLLFNIDAVYQDPSAALGILFYQLVELTSHMGCGTTISLVYITKDSVTVCRAGDSPVLLLPGDGKTIFSSSHNARTNIVERNAALARGGRFNGAYLINPKTGDGTQLTRALGDWHLGDVILREPEFMITPINANAIVMVCTDGLMGSNPHAQDNQTFHAILLLQDGGTAPDLIDWAMHNQPDGLEDNVSVVVWRPTHAEQI